jgi:preprotein translocase subunit SecF
VKFPLKLVPDNTNLRFLRLRFWAMGFSLSLIALSVVLVITQSFNFGVDFVGGQMIRVTFAQPANLDTLRAKIGGLGLGDAQIQEFGSPKDVSIRLRLPDGDEAAANASAARVKAVIVSVDKSAAFQAVETVSGKVSGELLRTGAISLILAMMGISLYIWFRFEWQFGVGALFALFHDVALTLGFFALTRLEFNLNVVAALLTIIGYSLNDTIIVYDRIRENMKKYRKMEMVALLDLSVNETLSRTIVTSLSLILTLTILLVLGPEVIFGFTAAMLLGIFVGTFSSIYVGAPILIWLKVKSDSFLPKEARMGNAERVTRRDEGQV